tara:strand:+ start:196 stop:339 length:144 start_codon:yes stop_codon:yes gene_type:complete
MTDPILYLSVILGLGVVYLLITSLKDYDDESDDEKYLFDLELSKAGR